MAIWIEASFNGIVRSNPLSLEPITLGRSSKSTIKFDDELLSSIHVRLSLRLGKAYLEDMESKNGVFVNHSRVANVFLKIGDEVKIGNTSLRLIEQKMSSAERANHK
jgi:pSer/pThr/pTyr-binding forkhead associated (FHA) protein